jgi:hypothetical protein
MVALHSLLLSTLLLAIIVVLCCEVKIETVLDLTLKPEKKQQESHNGREWPTNFSLLNKKVEHQYQ